MWLRAEKITTGCMPDCSQKGRDRKTTEDEPIRRRQTEDEGRPWFGCARCDFEPARAGEECGMIQSPGTNKPNPAGASISADSAVSYLDGRGRTPLSLSLSLCVCVCFVMATGNPPPGGTPPFPGGLVHCSVASLIIFAFRGKSSVAACLESGQSSTSVVDRISEDQARCNPPNPIGFFFL